MGTKILTRFIENWYLERELKNLKQGFRFDLWASLAIIMVFLVFNFNWFGNAIANIFGQGADKWLVNIILCTLLIYILLTKKDRK